MVTADDLLAAYRRANPHSRAVRLVRFVKNGTSVRQMGCILCGGHGPTWCGNWRKTKAAVAWEIDHSEEHVRVANAAALATVGLDDGVGMDRSNGKAA